MHRDEDDKVQMRVSGTRPKTASHRKPSCESEKPNIKDEKYQDFAGNFNVKKWTNEHEEEKSPMGGADSRMKKSKFFKV